MSDNKSQDIAAQEASRGLFNPGSDHHQDMKRHECHHYMSTYGGQLARSVIAGFGMTLGADAANALVGDARRWWEK